VTAPTLKSIAVTPPSPSIAKGLTQQFTATGTYTDSSTQNLTSQVTWNSATPATATITTLGLATGAGVGTSTISATLGAVQGSTVLTVTAATLQLISVTPASPSIAKGLTQQFTATATYSDNSTQNLTASVTWTSATTTVATITASGGLATGVGLGTSNITASLNAVTSPADILTVTVPTLVSIPLSACDVIQNGAYSVADVQRIINEVLGVLPAPNDLNGDGKVDVVDAQIVLNAVLGLGCTTSTNTTLNNL
jgi:uncharacterized protein YjdB